MATRLQTVDENTPTIVMFHMILWLKRELEAARDETARAQDVAHTMIQRATFFEEHAARFNQQVNLLQVRLEEAVRGGSMVANSVEQMYRLYNGLRLSRDMTSDERLTLERTMLQADMGFSVLHGVPLVDLTTGEETEIETDSETESESEQTHTV